MLNELRKLYSKNKSGIEARLNEFKKAGLSTDRKIFAEMCFCILTPQSKAVKCSAAIKKLVETSVLYEGNETDIREYLGGVRFPNNKAGYIYNARKEFLKNGRVKIKEFLKERDLFVLRNMLVKKVKGYGLKEASHFLRNIGAGADIAILDRHILSEMKRYGIISNISGSISGKIYIYLENNLRIFSKKVRIPMDALDLLFWYNKTGYFFK